MRKKHLFVVSFFLLLLLLFGTSTAYAEEDLEEALDGAVTEQLEQLDFEALEQLLSEVSDGSLMDQGFLEIVKAVLNGDFAEGSDSFFQAVLNFFFADFQKYLLILVPIAAIAVLSGLFTQQNRLGQKSTSNIVFFACFSVVIVLVLAQVFSLLQVTQNSINLIKSQMDVIFPILLTLMAGLGGVVSVKVYQPAVLVLSTGVVEVISSLILPMFVFTIVFSIVGNLSKEVRLSKLTEFCKSSSKTILTVTFTLFSAFLTVQGLTAGTYDGISIRAAKFATKSYVPILGGYLSDGFDLILTSTMLIKNSVGVAGLVLLLLTVLTPVVAILMTSLGLKFVCAVTEPVADKRITDFLFGVSKTLNMLMASILAVGFMYFIFIMLVIFTSNVFV